MKSGIFPGMDEKEYRDSIGISGSLLTSGDTMAEIKWKMDHPEEPTDSMNLGTAIHLAFLQPELCESRLAWFSGDLRSNAAKSEYAALEVSGKIILRDKDRFNFQGILTALKLNEDVQDILKNEAEKELSIFSPYADVQLKGCLDWLGLYNGTPHIVDLKTCQDASPIGFAKEVLDRKYHVKMALYKTILEELEYENVQCMWIAAESKPPWQIAVYRPDEVMLKKGQLKFKYLLTEFLKCKESGQWPGYRAGIQELELPPYSR